ncbi:hypothetical protein NX059_002352 [Plenodomus lindquistii]|nr:hypothetical protein NX059_002352 [Plenodomus lindquistii]
MAARIAQHSSARMGYETNRAPHPPAAGGRRACIAHTWSCTSVPRLSSSTRCRPAAPGISLQLSTLSEPSALPRCFYTILFGLLSYAAPFVSAIPKLRYILVGAVSLQEPDSISCMHAPRQSEVTHAAPGRAIRRCMRIRPSGS